MTVAVSNTPSHYQLAKQHLGQMKYVHAALGFHPLAVAECYKELPLFLQLLPEAKFVGEIGLDLSTEGRTTRELQEKVFTSIIQAIGGSKKFVTIHSRGAADEVFETLKRFDCRNVVFHWYSGSVRTLEQAVEWGCWFSVNPSMLGSQKGVDIIERIPKNRVLTETDGPYVKIGKRAAHPPDVRSVLTSLSELWRLPESVVEQQVDHNFSKACGDMGCGVSHQF